MAPGAAGVAGGGSACSKPGSKKLAGETLCVVLIPPQPAPTSTRAAIAVHSAIFHFNLISGKPMESSPFLQALFQVIFRSISPSNLTSGRYLPGWQSRPEEVSKVARLLRPSEPASRARQFFCVLSAVCFCLPGALCAGDTQFRAHAEQTFQRAQQLYESQPQDVQAAWEYARACFDLADFATNNAQRARVAELGIAAARQALERDSNSAAAHYYYGMNLGQLAHTKLLGALKLVGQMEREFQRALALNESFDHAGADRNLGLLYRDAPSVGSVGDRAKAREHLLRAVELAPDFPENQLNLIEAYLKWGRRDDARQQLKKLEAILPQARAKFTGPASAPDWADWDHRIEVIKQRLGVENGN